MKNIVVIYHSADFDGEFSREIAKKHLGDRADYIGWNYGDPMPIIPRGTAIYMIDISVEGLMHRPELIWIDHHKSAIEQYTWPINGYRIDGVAACRLAWQWFNHACCPELVFPNTGLPTKQDFVDRLVFEPLAVRLAGEYDIWDKRDPRAELFQHGLKSRELTAEWWNDLLEPTISELAVAHLLRDGEVLQYARTQENKSIITRSGFTVEFQGLKFLAVNAARYNSLLFTAGLKPEHDGCLGFHWDGTKWRVSLYGVPGKPDIDFSVIAKMYGGGGHKQACGFECRGVPPPWMFPCELTSDGKEVVFFIDEEDFGEGYLLNSRRSAHEWLDAFFDNLEPAEVQAVRFKREHMTKEEIEALPDI